MCSNLLHFEGGIGGFLFFDRNSSFEKILFSSLLSAITLRYISSKSQRFNFTYRAYCKRSRRGSYKNNNNKCRYRETNKLKRDYIYKIEHTDLEIGVSGVLLRILFYFEACRCTRQTGSVYALRINLLNIMIQRTLLRGRGTYIIMKLKEWNKEVKYKKNKKKTNKSLHGLKLKTFWL